MNAVPSSFFLRHDFLIRRLHSLSGLIPVGAYMTVHLIVNSTLLNGPGAYQSQVNAIHSLGVMLPLVEWVFIFIPLIFHAVVGIWILGTGKANVSQYHYVNNFRYMLQRWTGVIATIFILFHVFHMHGWFHNEFWLKNVAEPLGMAQFRPYNAASTLAAAMKGYVWPVFYLIGVLACVYHLANGIWTMGITWGVWLTPKAQERANVLCAIFGLFLLAAGLGSLWGAKETDVEEARRVENMMYDQRVKTPAEIRRDLHKRSAPEPASGVAVEP
jgi:succinate dehydrogenase / fumarate reductase cytochrome b subunit